MRRITGGGAMSDYKTKRTYVVRIDEPYGDLAHYLTRQCWEPDERCLARSRSDAHRFTSYAEALDALGSLPGPMMRLSHLEELP